MRLPATYRHPSLQKPQRKEASNERSNQGHATASSSSVRHPRGADSARYSDAVLPAVNYQLERKGRGYKDYAVRPLKASYTSTEAHDNWAAKRQAEAQLTDYLESR